MSISGFLVFTNKTQGNILNNFSEDDWLINLARACVRTVLFCPLPERFVPEVRTPSCSQFGLNMFTTLPLEAFVCREVAETYFWPGEHEFNKKRHVIITSALVFSALMGASEFFFLPPLVNQGDPLPRGTNPAHASCPMQSRSSRVTSVSSSNSPAASRRQRSHTFSVSWAPRA
jgi:hypothetical protein